MTTSVALCAYYKYICSLFISKDAINVSPGHCRTNLAALRNRGKFNFMYKNFWFRYIWGAFWL